MVPQPSVRKINLGKQHAIHSALRSIWFMIGLVIAHFAVVWEILLRNKRKKNLDLNCDTIIRGRMKLAWD